MRLRMTLGVSLAFALGCGSAFDIGGDWSGECVFASDVADITLAGQYLTNGGSPDVEGDVEVWRAEQKNIALGGAELGVNNGIIVCVDPDGCVFPDDEGDDGAREAGYFLDSSGSFIMEGTVDGDEMIGTCYYPLDGVSYSAGVLTLRRD